MNVLALLNTEEKRNLRLALGALIQTLASVEARIPHVPGEGGGHGGGAPAPASPAPPAPKKATMTPSSVQPDVPPPGTPLQHAPSFTLPGAAQAPAPAQPSNAKPPGFDQAVKALQDQFTQALQASGYTKDAGAVKGLIESELLQKPAGTVFRMVNGALDFCEDAQLFANDLQSKILAL